MERIIVTPTAKSGERREATVETSKNVGVSLVFARSGQELFIKLSGELAKTAGSNSAGHFCFTSDRCSALNTASHPIESYHLQ